MTTVYFVRHGIVFKPQNVIMSRTPGFHLSEEGRKGVKKTASEFVGKEITKIYASPMERCQETAEIIGETLDLDVTTDKRLNEVKNVFQGMLEDEWNGKYPDKIIYQLPEQQEKGEMPEQIVARMRSFLDEVLEKFENQSIVTVSHGDPIMFLEYSLIGKRYLDLRDRNHDYIPRAGYFEWQFEGINLVKETRSWG